MEFVIEVILVTVDLSVMVVAVELGDADGGLTTFVFNTLPKASNTTWISIFSDFEEPDGDG